MSEEKTKQKGFIQIPILIVIILGVVLIGGTGYVAVKQYQGNNTNPLFENTIVPVNPKVLSNTEIIDKVKPQQPSSWRIIGEGKITEVIEKKLGAITDQDMLGHKEYASKDEILETYRVYYGDRVTLDTPVKIIRFDFMPNTSGDVPLAGMLLDEAKLYTDGGSRGNPGESAGAFVICKMDDTVVEKSGYYIGIATNNQAEYYGFKKGLERALELGIDEITLFSDSQLVVNQMNGIYKVKNQELAPLHEDVKTIAAGFSKVQYVYIPREINKIADEEVNRILDEQAKNKKRFKKR